MSYSFLYPLKYLESAFIYSEITWVSIVINAKDVKISKTDIVAAFVKHFKQAITI